MLGIALKPSGITISCKIAGGGASTPALRAAYQGADVAVCGWVAMPTGFLGSLDAPIVSSRTEGYAVAVGESVEEGTPVFGVDVGGVGDVIGARSGRERV